MNRSGRNRVLVTGASGFIGQHLVEALTASGAEVYGISRTVRRGLPGPTRWLQADVEKLEEVERLWDVCKPDVVYHLSGAANGMPDIGLLLPTYHSLLTTTVNFLQVATTKGCRRLILASSLEDQDPRLSAETPASPYSAAKTALLAYARMCHEVFETPVVMLRTFMTYGPGQPSWKLIPSTLEKLLVGLPPDLSTGRRELDWIYISDVVEAFMQAAHAPGIEGATIDVGSGELTSIRELVIRLVALVSPDVKPRFGVQPDRPQRTPRIADVSASCERLGWRAKTQLDEGLRRTIEAYRIARATRTG
jgi:nucleoside-diphosphate-sugar epimerase